MSGAKHGKTKEVQEEGNRGSQKRAVKAEANRGGGTRCRHNGVVPVRIEAGLQALGEWGSEAGDEDSAAHHAIVASNESS